MVPRLQFLVAVAPDARPDQVPADVEVQPVAFGAPFPADPSIESVGIVVVGEQPGPAVAVTRRWRADVADPLFTILWLCPTAGTIPLGLDAGADTGIVGPVSTELLQAYAMAAYRRRLAGAKYAGLAIDARQINDRLQLAYRELSDAARLAMEVRAAARTARLPSGGPFRFGIGRAGPDPTHGDYAVVRLDDQRIGFWLADTGGAGSITAGLIGLAVRQFLAFHDWSEAGARWIPVHELVDRVNRGLIGLAIDPPPLVGLTVGVLDTVSGAIHVSRAGLPAAVKLPAAGEPELWLGPGPFLGAFDADFPPVEGFLATGDCLILATAGAAKRIAAVADRHRGLSPQAIADAIAQELVDPTLVVVIC